jgi:hypothetical protein
VRGYHTEGSEQLLRTLAQPAVFGPGAAFARCYPGAVTNAQGDYATTTGFLEESQAIFGPLVIYIECQDFFKLGAGLGGLALPQIAQSPPVTGFHPAQFTQIILED